MSPLVRRSVQAGIVLLGGFFVLALASGYWQVVRADSLRHDAVVNGDRIAREATTGDRGRLLDRDGNVLAETVTGPDGKPARHYTDPGAAQVVGYTIAGVGAAGAEAAAADRLAGRAPTDLIASLQNLVHWPHHGADVRLTLDPAVQRAAEQAMGGAPGAAVAIDPVSGQVLAMVSNPTFNPNNVDAAGWQALSAQPNSPLLNRATEGLYTPGSTFKTVTLAAALQAGLVKASDPATCPESITIDGHTITSHNEPPGKHTQTVADAYAYSCNTFFAKLGVELGADRLKAMADALGVSDAVPFDLTTSAGQVGGPGFLTSDSAIASTAFGQGELLVTPLELALITAAAANNGLVPVPRLFMDEAPATWRRGMSADTAHALAAIMQHSVDVGWANTAAIPGVTVGGKTGSAEVFAGQPTHAVFIAFAPVDHPRIAVAVLKERAGAGSTQAGPVARAMIAALLQR